MSNWLVLAPIVGVGIGMAAAYGAKHGELEQRIHFASKQTLQEELDELDIELQEGETCEVCGDSISPDEIGTVYLDGGEYRIVCDKQICLDTYDID